MDKHLLLKKSLLFCVCNYVMAAEELSKYLLTQMTACSFKNVKSYSVKSHEHICECHYDVL